MQIECYSFVNVLYFFMFGNTPKNKIPIGLTNALIVKTIRIRICLAFQDFLGVIHVMSIRKSRTRVIYCRILDFAPEKADSNPNVIYTVSDFGTHAPDIGQTSPDLHNHGM